VADTLQRPTLLVVDDEHAYRRVLAHLLRDLVRVETCGDGEAALALLGRRRFDWVLLDVGLPGMDGFEVLKRIRARHPACRVLLHSAGCGEDAAGRARAAGAIAFLEKPLSLPVLRSMLGR
jgi:CheY-like chemotaxis protein